MNLGTAVLDWAASLPGATAVIDGDAYLDRRDLAVWASDVAEILQDMLPRPRGEGVPVVALLLPRSWAVPFSMAAARVANMAFLPLDTRQPAARLGGILRQARPSLILSFENAETMLRAAIDQAGLGISSVTILEAPHPDLERIVVHGIPGGRRLPSDIGHLVFTSGSTGAPKGVLLRDGPLLATVAAQRVLLGTDLETDEAFSPSIWTLNPAFDASLSDMFCALLGSAPLAVYREEQSRWRGLAALARRLGAVRADLAPSLMRIVPPEAMGLTAVIFGGERCDPATAARWGCAARAFQAYGPTEAAVCAMIARAGEDWYEGLLGRPLDHQTVLLSTPDGVYQVLPRFPAASPDDAEAFNAVMLEPYDDDAAENGPPPVIEGEIWLAGDAVAAGYLDNPEATAKRFGQLDGVAVHYSGDLARFDGGQLHWIGRNDRQVKVNGRLICPEEIEAVAGVAWGGPCACMPDERGLTLVLGERTAAGPCPDTSAVLAQIARDLGPGMRPRLVVEIGAWPLNANGKTDLAEVARRVAGCVEGLAA